LAKGEVLAAFPAIVEATPSGFPLHLLDAGRARFAAMRAGRTMWPNRGFDICESGVFVLEAVL
jgi:hypothetical protein